MARTAVDAGMWDFILAKLTSLDEKMGRQDNRTSSPDEKMDRQDSRTSAQLEDIATHNAMMIEKMDRQDSRTSLMQAQMDRASEKMDRMDSRSSFM